MFSAFRKLNRTLYCGLVVLIPQSVENERTFHDFLEEDREEGMQKNRSLADTIARTSKSANNSFVEFPSKMFLLSGSTMIFKVGAKMPGQPGARSSSWDNRSCSLNDLLRSGSFNSSTATWRRIKGISIPGSPTEPTHSTQSSCLLLNKSNKTVLLYSLRSWGMTITQQRFISWSHPSSRNARSPAPPPQ